MDPPVIEGKVGDAHAPSACRVQPEHGPNSGVDDDESSDYDEELPSGRDFIAGGIHDIGLPMGAGVTPCCELKENCLKTLSLIPEASWSALQSLRGNI